MRLKLGAADLVDGGVFEEPAKQIEIGDFKIAAKDIRGLLEEMTPGAVVEEFGAPRALQLVAAIQTVLLSARGANTVRSGNIKALLAIFRRDKRRRGGDRPRGCDG